ncbi:MAG TPA: FtsX-like permease family protein [Clostridia bacterium]|nr:FtsX-like permease family protein [Clostridia bacterium]
MVLFMKALLKSLAEKKARTALVLFSIAVSAALIFANECFAKVCEQKFYNADVRWGGNSDICMMTRDTVGAKEWIDEERLSKYDSLFAYRYQFIKEMALYTPSIEKMHYFTIIGTDINEFNSYNPVTLSQGDFNDWNGYKAIIGSVYAKEYSLKVNDIMALELDGKTYDFRIAGISKAKGLFTRELADGGFILVPRDTLAGIFKGGSNVSFMKLKDSSQKKYMKDRLTDEFGEYLVEYGVNDALIAAETNNYVMPFRISAVAVVFMSMFIIFTAFNLITLERIPLIGTLRSIGCSRVRVNRLLIAESIFLGAFGGLIGCILGVGVLQVIIKIYFANDAGVLASKVALNSASALTAVGIAIAITVASAILPILRITRIPIKNIILNDIRKKQSGRNRLWIAGLVLMALCAIVPRFLRISFTDMIIGNIAATGALIGMIPLVPFLVRGISRLTGKLPFLRYDIILGIRNICDNKSLLNNIQLFSAAIAIVAFMSSIFNSMSADLIKAYDRDTKYDILLVLRHTDLQTLSKISAIEGVRDCFGSYRADPDIPDHNTFFNMLYGIDNAKFFDYNIVKQLDTNKEAMANLDMGKNIITTNILKDKLGLKMGDPLVIKFGSRNVRYTVTGFVETNFGIGHVGYISADNFKKDAGVSDYTEIYIKTKGNPDTVKINILRALNRDVMSINTKEELKIANSDKVDPIFNAIRVYSYIALLVGLIGIVNNLIAGFLQRKRSLAMLRSIGMSRRSMNRMLITEAAGMGLSGILFGLATAVVMSSTIPSIVSIFWGKVTVVLPMLQMEVMGAAGVLAMLAIAAVPVVKGNRLSIIESIKYE